MSGSIMSSDGAAALSRNLIDLDDHTAWLIQQLASNGPTSTQAATALTIEELRRLGSSTEFRSRPAGIPDDPVGAPVAR